MMATLERKRRSGTLAKDDVLQLKVFLQEVRPLVWRRLLIPASTTLPKLHRILQVAMGWENYHLHVFSIGEDRYGTPDPDYPDDTRDERWIPLRTVLPLDITRFAYEYDFGDSWQHVLVIEGVVGVPDNVRLPFCLDGARACPPEDVGGVSGYQEYRSALRHPRHPDHADILRWRGPFDSEAFDRDAVNRKLARLR